MDDEADVCAVRARFDLTQEGFAARFGFNLGTVRSWEQERRQPHGAARLLLRVIAPAPEMVDAALATP